MCLLFPMQGCIYGLIRTKLCKVTLGHGVGCGTTPMGSMGGGQNFKKASGSCNHGIILFSVIVKIIIMITLDVFLIIFKMSAPHKGVYG